MSAHSKLQCHYQNVSTSSIILLAFMATAVIAAPLTVMLVALLRSRKNRNRMAEEAQRGYRLREFKLRPTTREFSRCWLPPIETGSNMPRISVKRMDCTSSQRSKKRLSRPTRIPVHLPLRSSRAPDPTTNAERVPEAIHKSVSETSLISMPSTALTGTFDPTSPVSPISPATPTAHLSTPEPVYQPHNFCAHNGRTKAGNSILTTSTFDCDYNHDLFISTRPNNSTLVTLDREHPVVQNDQVSHPGIKIKKAHKSKLRPDRYDFDDTEVIWDSEWREARTETVDGVLAPREWV